MCGRARLSSDVSEIKLVFSIPPDRPPPNFPPSWNVAPTDSLPVVRYDRKAEQRRLDLLRWGLIPYWAKDIKVGFANINAKAEGIETKRTFRDAFERRCVPARRKIRRRPLRRNPKDQLDLAYVREKAGAATHGAILAREAAVLQSVAAGGRKAFRHGRPEALAGFTNIPRIGEWRRQSCRTDGLFDNGDNGFFKEFQQPHARTVAKQQPARGRVVALDDADRQLRRPKGQLRVALRLLVVRAGDQLLRAIQYGAEKRVRRGIFGRLA